MSLCLCEEILWAIMSTTRASGSVDAFFDKYIKNSKTTFKQLVEKYGNAMRDKHGKEIHANYNSFTVLFHIHTTMTSRGIFS